MHLRPVLAALAAVAAVALAAPGGARAQSPSSARGGANGPEITLAIGDQYTLPATNIRSYSLAVEGIADVRTTPGQDRLLIVGQHAGNTSMVVIHEDGSQTNYAITVFRMAANAVRQQVEQLTQPYPGVSISTVGGRLFLEGGVASDAQLRRVQQIAAIYQGQVESLVSLDPTIVERRINVRIDLYYVELSRTSNYMFGIGWPSSIGGAAVSAPFTLQFGTPTTVGVPPLTGVYGTLTISQLLPRLDIAATNGWARVYRQSTVVTVNGNEASSFSGGEYNTTTTSSLGTPSVLRIEFGTLLTILPRFDPTTSRVELRVQGELSSLTQTGAPIPGRDISRLNTLVNLQLGQSMMLSGFNGRSATHAINGLPGLSQIPLIGWLFGSMSHTEQDNQTVVFIVPTVIDGLSRTAEDRVANAMRQYEDFASPALLSPNAGYPDNPPLVPAPSTGPLRLTGPTQTPNH